MELIGWILLGLTVGIAARNIFPRSARGGPTLLILLGIAGAMLAGFTCRSLQLTSKATAGSFMAAALGAGGLILIFRFMARRRTAC